MSHVAKYFDQARQITDTIDHQEVEKMAEALAALKDNGGRLFLVGAPEPRNVGTPLISASK